MRPLGHDAAREGRDVSVGSIDERLLDAWRRFKQRSTNSTNDISLSAYACELLEPLQPSLMQLHQLMLYLSQDASDHVPFGGYAPGNFFSAGYAYVPEREISYDFDTDGVKGLGKRLEGKHFIVNGTLGSTVGHRLIGSLTINGRAGPYTGLAMIGTLTLNGDGGFRPGSDMIGYIANHSGRALEQERNVLGYDGTWWNIPAGKRKEFLHAITNPNHLPYQRLYDRLVATYGGHR
jgi:hypothetical protein